MKHIKKFNEEFYPSTYKKIGDSEDFADEFKKKYPSPFNIFREI